MIRFAALVLVVLALLAACVAPSPRHEGPRQITLVYSGNLDGELEPCGCSEGGNKGGIKRRVQQVDTLRRQQPELFLISAGGLLVSEMPQDKLKSEYILKGLAQLDYDAIGVQWQDLAFGVDFLTRENLPLVASNWRGKGLAHSRVVRKAGVGLAFFQWLDPEADPQRAMGEPLVNDDPGSLVERLRAARQAGQLTVLSTTLPLARAQALFPLQWVDVLLIEARYEYFGEPRQVGHTLVLQPGSRGMRLGQVELVLDETGRIASWQHEVIPLPPEVGDAPRMQAWYDEYNARVKAAYQRQVALRKQLMSGDSPYAGERACESCHREIHDIWFDSRHAEAFYALQDVNKAFDPDCIACHTVGFGRQGGFIDPALTPDLMHVQCESCHGPARAHVDSGGKTPVANAQWQPQAMCAQCHVPKHSPDFDFSRYWPRIAHGGK